MDFDIMRVSSYAAHSATSDLVPYEFDRREPTDYDVEFEVLFCGVCHSDMHTAKAEWDDFTTTVYPFVGGHEIVGKVTRTGTKVSKFKIGDTVGVGCIVNSCRKCKNCKAGLQQYCEEGMVGTYNSEDPVDGQITKGGYSAYQVVQEDYILRIPEGMDLAKAAPLLCAGITTYSPLKHWKVGPGVRVGILGLGGLGHMGLKYAKALGATVDIITTSPDKAAKYSEMGADGAVLMSDESAVEAAAAKYDFLLNTIPMTHDLSPYLELLAVDGTMVVVGPLAPLEGIHGQALMSKRRTLAGSQIGGIPETQEMLDFSSAHGITSDIELIEMKDINKAYATLKSKGIAYRYVIDVKNSLAPAR
jgi:uncharacterized zinc-type alcohol dehydrogenase-like protein